MQPVPNLPDLLLAMDTSGDVCSIAVFRGGQLMSEHAFRHEMHLSERLIDYVDAALRAVPATLQDVGCFAVGIGPGSFTGARIGVMTMKTFAFMHERSIFAVDSMEAMAAEYCGLRDVAVIPVLACRSGVVYGCPYSVDGAIPVPLANPAALTFAEIGLLMQGVEARTLLFCGPAARRYETELRATVSKARPEQAAFGAVAFPRASAIGRLALHRIASGVAPSSALEIVPLYISPPPITIPKQPIPK